MKFRNIKKINFFPRFCVVFCEIDYENIPIRIEIIEIIIIKQIFIDLYLKSK